MKRQFIAYFWFVGWDCFSLGVHVCFSQPNIEIHVPFGFIRIGWKKSNGLKASNHDTVNWRLFGLGERYDT